MQICQGETFPAQDNVREAEAYDLSECKSSEDLKLPDEVISTVATDSILTQDGQDERVEPVEA